MVYFEMFLTQILGGEGWNEVSNPIIHLAGAQAALRCGPAWPSAEAARRRSAKGSTFAEPSYQLDCL